MNRKDDVNAILDAASQQFQGVKQGYEKALKDCSLDLRVPVKNLMENLRSALDYMAHDIYETCCQPHRLAGGHANPKNVYFPYGCTEADFRSGIGSSLPGLPTYSPTIHDLLLSVQPFRCADTWLVDLCSIINEKKHDRLKAQVRSEAETYSVKGQSGGVSIPVNNPNFKITSLPGAVRIFGVPAQFTPQGIRTAPSDQLQHTRTKWIGFTFEGTDVNVLGLLTKAVAGVKGLAENLYHEI